MAARMFLLLLVAVSAALSATARKEGPGPLAVGEYRANAGRSLSQTGTVVTTPVTPAPVVVPTGVQQPQTQLPAVLLPTTTTQPGITQPGVTTFPTTTFPTTTFPTTTFPTFPTTPGTGGFVQPAVCPAGYTLTFGRLGEECVLTSLLNTNQGVQLQGR